MASKNPNFVLYLHHLSRLASTGLSAQEMLDEVQAAMRKLLFIERATLTLQVNPEAAALQAGLSDDSGRAEVRLLFSHPVRVRGVQYGFLSAEVTSPLGSPVDWMSTLETTAQQLALYAEKLRISEERERLLRERDLVALELQTQKLLARASGILASTQGVSEEEAYSWILSEAGRRKNPVLDFAEQLIDRYAGAGLRRVAA